MVLIIAIEFVACGGLYKYLRTLAPTRMESLPDTTNPDLMNIDVGRRKQHVAVGHSLLSLWCFVDFPTDENCQWSHMNQQRGKREESEDSEYDAIQGSCTINAVD
jgi:hypothetical protein